MKLYDLPVEEVVDTLEMIMDDYFVQHLQEDEVQTECIEKFFERMEDIATLHGMTKIEGDMFCDVLFSVYNIILERKIKEEEQDEVVFQIDEDLPF